MENNYFDSEEFQELLDNTQLPKKVIESDSFQNLLFNTYLRGQQDK